MKMLLAIMVILICVSGGYAQIDRTKVPLPGPEKEVRIADYQSFELDNGLRVFVVEDHRLPRIRFLIQLLNNPVREGQKAGYVEIAGELIGSGTTKRAKAELDEAVDYLGASLATFGTGISASVLTKHKERIVALMTDVLYNPSFDEKEFEKIKKQTLSAIAANEDNPNVIAQDVANVLIYGKGHPYGEITTEATVKAITIEDCKHYYDVYFKPNNAYLVMVGDITLAEARLLANANFASWKPGDIPAHTYEVPKTPKETIVALADRPTSVQSSILLGYPIALTIGHPDELASKVMNNILGRGSQGRLFKNLRTTHGYTYGAYSHIDSDPLMGSFIAYMSTRNEVTDSAVYELVAELNRMVETPLQDEELRLNKASMAGAFVRSLESPSTIADFAVNIAKYGLPKDYYYTFLKRLDGISAMDVKRMAQKYIRPNNAYIIIVGNAAQVGDKLKRFGPVQYYDIHGNAYEGGGVDDSPTDLTAEDVINNYIDAIGGREKLERVRAIEIHYKIETMGNEFSATVVKKVPKKSLTEIKYGQSMDIERRVSDGSHVSVYRMGKRTLVDDNTTENILYNSIIFPELSAIRGALQVKLLGVERIHDKPTYVVQYMNASGKLSTAYYDKDTGLKVRDVQEMETEQGKVTSVNEWSDYREHDGIKFPWSIRQNTGQAASFGVMNLKVNPDVDDTIFAIE